MPGKHEKGSKPAPPPAKAPKGEIKPATPKGDKTPGGKLTGRQGQPHGTNKDKGYY